MITKKKIVVITTIHHLKELFKMSLTHQQELDTIHEFQENISLTGLSLQQIATDLKTHPKTIEQIIQLRPHSIEEPWILRNYLLEKITEQGKTPIPFTALVGSHHDYYFLNARKIDKKELKSNIVKQFFS